MTCHDRDRPPPAVQDATTVSDLPAYIETPAGTSLQPGCVRSVLLGSRTDRDGVRRLRSLGHFDQHLSLRRRACRSAKRRERGRHLGRDSTTPPCSRRLRAADPGCSTAKTASPTRARHEPRLVRVVGIQISPAGATAVGRLPADHRSHAGVRARSGRPPRPPGRPRGPAPPGASIAALQVQADQLGFATEVQFTRAEVVGPVGCAIRPNEISLMILGASPRWRASSCSGKYSCATRPTRLATTPVMAALGMRTRDRIAGHNARRRSRTARGDGRGRSRAARVSAHADRARAQHRTIVRLDFDSVAPRSSGAVAIVLFVVGITVVATAVTAGRREHATRTKPARLANAAARRVLPDGRVRRTVRARTGSAASRRPRRQRSFVGLTIASGRGRRLAHVRRRPHAPAIHAPPRRVGLGRRADLPRRGLAGARRPQPKRGSWCRPRCEVHVDDLQGWR